MGSAQVLASFIRSHPTFKVLEAMEGSYGHMGATLTDAVLQAGVNYDTVVRPRVDDLRTGHPEAATTSGFLALLEMDGGVQKLLRWRGGRKIDTLLELTRTLASQHVETEDDFRSWISVPGNLDGLRRIKGIKDKTVNYIEILLGRQSVAVDRHLYRFLAEAGVATTDYDVAQAAIRDAAALLRVDAALLDHSIWRYMATRAGTSD